MKRVMAAITTAAVLALALLAGNQFANADEGVAAVPEISSVPVPEQSTVAIAEPVSQEPAIETVAAAAAHTFNTDRWGIERIGAAAAWDAAGTFGPVLVAVLDTGIAGNAPFASRVVGSIDLSGEGTVEDLHGHGTHMAGTIAAIAPNAELLNVKVADKRGRCDTAVVARGIRWAADRGALVINVSLEMAPSAELEAAVRHAWQRGAVVVVSAGNSGSDAPAYPAAYPDALAVAGTNQSDGLAVLSNHGDWVDIAAPGHKIYAERPGAEFGYETGTSPAASHVSGVAALLFGAAVDQSGDGLLNDEVRGAIESTAWPLAAAGTGAGLVNAQAAVLALGI